jgi:hypothetical protein
MAANDAITVAFTLTRQEYLSAHRLAISRRPIALIVPALGLALVVVGLFGSARYVIVGCVLLGAGVVWLGAAWLRWRRDPAQAGPFTYRFDDDGIAISSPAGEVALPWTRVRTVIVGKQMVVLLSPGSGVMVPWRAVHNGDRQRLETLLHEHSAD